MIVTFDTKRMTSFVKEHKGELLIAAVALVVINRQKHNLSEMRSFIGAMGLTEQFNQGLS